MTKRFLRASLVSIFGTLAFLCSNYCFGSPTASQPIHQRFENDKEIEDYKMRYLIGQRIRTAAPPDGLAVGDLSKLISLKYLNLSNYRSNWRKPPADSYLDMVSLRGIEAFPDLKALNLEDSYIKDEDLLNLKLLINLEGINISGTQAGDVGMSYIENLPKLVFILAAKAQVTDDGLNNIGNLSQLKYLDLSNTSALFDMDNLSKLGEDFPTYEECFTDPTLYCRTYKCIQSIGHRVE